MSVKELNYLQDFERATSSDNLSVVDFSAEWCGPCLQIAPRIDQLASQNPNVSFYKVDVDRASDIAARSNITAMPTFQFYKKGKLLATVVGANYGAVKDKVQKLQ